MKRILLLVSAFPIVVVAFLLWALLRLVELMERAESEQSRHGW